jgi:hypothetical protein
MKTVKNKFCITFSAIFVRFIVYLETEKKIKQTMYSKMFVKKKTKQRFLELFFFLLKQK